MDRPSLKAQKRNITGRKVKTLRNKGILPANIFGKKVKSQEISIDQKEFEQVFKKAGETTLVNLKLDAEKSPRAVLISNIQADPLTESPLHVDFHQVDLKEKVVAQVPVEVIGESPAEKTGIGTAVTYIDEIEVEALPGDLPENFMVDISNLSEVDQAIFIKDLKIDKNKIEIKDDLESIIVKVEPPQKEEVIEVPTPVEGEETAEREAGEETAKEEPTEGAEKPKEEAPEAKDKE